MTKVLTIEREYGSGANEIAEKVAERLGWKLWDQSLTTEIARRLECDRVHVEQHEERRDPLHHRLFKAFLRGSFEGSLNTHRLKLADAEGKSEQEATELAETVDQDRAVFLKQHFGVEWPTREYFDVMINSIVGDAAAVEMILHAMEACQNR